VIDHVGDWIEAKEREVNPMNTQRRGLPFFPVVLLAALAIVVVAGLTTWWVLLALIPLTMMVGCAAMMTARARRSCVPGARRGCCAGGTASGEVSHEQRASEP
jgi:hypothetical protein